MDIKTGREKMAIAWANPKAAGVSMNIDLVQSVAHILVRECMQSQIDVLQALLDKWARNDNGYEFVRVKHIESEITAIARKLSAHNKEGELSGRALGDECKSKMEMNG